MSKNSFEIDGSWVGTAIVLGICLSIGPVGWLIGFFVLRNKLKQFKRGKNEAQQFNKIGASLLAAGLGMIAFSLVSFGLPVAFAGGVVLWYGKRAAEREKRYRKYMAIIADRDYMPIREIARTAAVPVDQVKAELQNMIDLGYFGTSAYIDARELRIVIDNCAAEESQYRKQPIYVEPEVEWAYEYQAEAAHREEEMRREQEAKQKEQAKAGQKDDFGSDEFGQWIRSIREVNDRIDDQVISDKIDRIETLTRRIFEMVRTRPEKEGQIRKFMNYYLPTTLKLLDSYALLEAQGIEGENISAAKQKIEGIMDTLIQGFEKQLDLLFSAQAMDINSDIQVLENMMAADGLKENEFKLKKSASAGK